MTSIINLTCPLTPLEHIYVNKLHHPPLLRLFSAHSLPKPADQRALHPAVNLIRAVGVGFLKGTEKREIGERRREEGWKMDETIQRDGFWLIGVWESGSESFVIRAPLGFGFMFKLLRDSRAPRFLCSPGICICSNFNSCLKLGPK
ncbi:hypothetical protein Baya_12655 [Bagarius yarrelli]|uniref:Uncharacterized protein n=1 Tax=Bagarius yarrelli TaxID=175774 RepID=A0A556V4D0_BAGYA|nr:hypothetical protein Baya_12655 [Bagarius yarrelli]